MLVFIPAVGEFVIPELVGTPESLMIGKVLWMEFFDSNNWPMAAAVTTTMLALLIAPIVYLHRREKNAGAGATRDGWGWRESRVIAPVRLGRPDLEREFVPRADSCFRSAELRLAAVHPRVAR